MKQLSFIFQGQRDKRLLLFQISFTEKSLPKIWSAGCMTPRTLVLLLWARRRCCRSSFQEMGICDCGSGTGSLSLRNCFMHSPEPQKIEFLPPTNQEDVKIACVCPSFSLNRWYQEIERKQLWCAPNGPVSEQNFP